MANIAVIDGHLDLSPARCGHALAESYADGARSAGHAVERITLAETDVAFLRSQRNWAESEPSHGVRKAQEAIGRADHLVIVYPLWLGTMPALLKAFFEQASAPGLPSSPVR